MINYLLPFLVYVLPLLSASQITYNIKTVLTLVLLLIYYKSYNIKWKITSTSIVTGIAIAAIWIASAMFFQTAPQNYNIYLKALSFLLVAPFIEELFIRQFLLRVLSSKNWKKYIPKFQWLPFILTSLIFGLAHRQWIAGIITGGILNLLYYNEKQISPCIIAHFIANAILLGMSIIYNIPI